MMSLLRALTITLALSGAFIMGAIFGEAHRKPANEFLGDGSESEPVTMRSLNVDDLPLNTDLRWSKPCKPRQLVTGDFACGWPELTEFVPDLPARLSDLGLVISDEPTAPELVAFHPNGNLLINRGDWLNCLYYDGHEVAMLVYTDRNKQHVRCRHG